MKVACIEEVEHGSDRYWQTVDLRQRVLRDPLKLEFTPGELEAENTSIHLASMIEDQIVACLILVAMTDDSFKMRQVAVEPKFQNKGVGSELVRQSETLARIRGGKVITLHAREEAVPFYERLGYTCTGDEFIEVTVPHRFMSKQLG